MISISVRIARIPLRYIDLELNLILFIALFIYLILKFCRKICSHLLLRFKIKEIRYIVNIRENNDELSYALLDTR